MVARTVEHHTDRGGRYWLAVGQAYGRTILAEGATRSAAIKTWTQGAAEYQATLMLAAFRAGKAL